MAASLTRLTWRDHLNVYLLATPEDVPTWALAEDAAILAGDAPHPGYGGGAGRALLGLERLFFGAPALPGVQPLRAGKALFDTAWRVLAAPGHTPGSLALFNEETGDLLSGDTLVSDFGWPRGPHPLFTADYDRAARSALELLDLEPKRIFPGHGRPRPCEAFDGVRASLARRLRRQAG